MDIDYFAKYYDKSTLFCICKEFGIKGVAQLNKKGIAKVISLYYSQIKDNERFKSILTNYEIKRKLKLEKLIEDRKNKTKEIASINNMILRFVSGLKVGDKIKTLWKGNTKSSTCYKFIEEILEGEIIAIAQQNNSILIKFEKSPLGRINTIIQYYKVVLFNKFISWRARFPFETEANSFIEQLQLIPEEIRKEISKFDGRLDFF